MFSWDYFLIVWVSAIVGAVHISERPISFYGWNGAGYIITDTVKGTGAYMLEGAVNGGKLKLLNKKDRKFFTALAIFKGYKAGKIIVGYFIQEIINSFITHLVNSSTSLNDCHKQVILRTLAVIQAINLMADVVGLFSFGLGGFILSSMIPLLIYPVIASATMEFVNCKDYCDSQANARMISASGFGIQAWSDDEPCFSKSEIIKWFNESNDPIKKKESHTVIEGYAQNIKNVLNNENFFSSEEKRTVKNWMNDSRVKELSGSTELFKSLTKSKNGNGIENVLAFQQSILKINDLFDENKSFRLEYKNGYKVGHDADIAIFEKDKFKEAIQLKSIRDDKNAIITNLKKTANKQLTEIQPSVQKTLEIKWHTGSLSDINSDNQFIDRMKKIMKGTGDSFKVDKLVIIDKDGKTQEYYP